MVDTSLDIDDPALSEIVRRLVAAYQPERIYLFGSVARGEAGPDSDYDLMVILPNDAPAKLRRHGLASETLRGIRAAADILIWSDEQFNKRLHLKASLPATVMREGKLLYDHDPERVAEVRAWLTRAARDLSAAELSLSVDPPLLDVVVFHCQQAAEKALKGFLAWHDVPFRRTHLLEDLGAQVVEIDATLPTEMQRAASLSDYAWRYRYPSDQEEPPRSEAEEALATARMVFEAMLARLPLEVRP